MINLGGYDSDVNYLFVTFVIAASFMRHLVGYQTLRQTLSDKASSEVPYKVTVLVAIN